MKFIERTLNGIKKNICSYVYMNRLTKKYRKNKGGTIFNKSKKLKSILKTHSTFGKPKKKQVIRINLKKNSIKEFEKDSPIKEDNNLHNYPDCYDIDSYPCKYEDTIFNTNEEYNEYIKMKKDRNISTGFKSRSKHYDDTVKYLKSKNMYAKKISQKNRLYDNRSGLIYDKKKISYNKSKRLSKY